MKTFQHIQYERWGGVSTISCTKLQNLTINTDDGNPDN